MKSKLFPTSFHPCCGFYLQYGLRWAAVVSVAVKILHFFLLYISIYRNVQKRYTFETDFDHYVLVFFWVIYSVVTLVDFFLDYILFKSVNQKKIRLLKLYIGGTISSLFVLNVAYWTNTIYFHVPLPNPRLGMMIANVIFKLHLSFCVYRFILEIKEEIQLNSDYRDLTESEVEEFVSGQPAPDAVVHYESRPLVETCLYGKYKKEEYEIALSSLDIDKRTPLGCGECGIVYRALMHVKSASAKVPVAVKTVNTCMSDVRHFKALLTELKIMTCIGKHKNIVNLIGASTEGIKKRKLYIVTELCVFGNLQDFLKTQRGTFMNLFDDGVFDGRRQSTEIIIEDDDDLTSTLDLVRWSKEVADGMDFLESRKVVHGDLAARNVLLTEQKVAKITDFGLARQLYNYAVYMKKQNGPLPWRWLALEVLVDMCFSTYSDIWSYGVTIWEVFQLAETPWPLFNFSLDFVSDLKRGQRLGKPKYATPEIYQVLLQCWHECPEKRPSFKYLSEFFEQTERELVKTRNKL